MYQKCGLIGSLECLGDNSTQRDLLEVQEEVGKVQQRDSEDMEGIPKTGETFIRRTPKSPYIFSSCEPVQ